MVSCFIVKRKRRNHIAAAGSRKLRFGIDSRLLYGHAPPAISWGIGLIAAGGANGWRYRGW